MKARVANIQYSFVDYPTPEDGCLTVFLSGCGHNCKGCHNKNLQDQSYGREISVEDLIKELKILSESHRTKKIVFQGGDPLYNTNLIFIRKFLDNNTDFDVCIYTGFNIEFVKKYFIKGEITYWKCGLYDVNTSRASVKTDERFVLASENQNFYDMNFKKISKKGILTF